MSSSTIGAPLATVPASAAAAHRVMRHHPALVAVVNKLRVLRNRGVVTIGRNRAFDSLSSDYYF